MVDSEYILNVEPRGFADGCEKNKSPALSQGFCAEQGRSCQQLSRMHCGERSASGGGAVGVKG